MIDASLTYHTLALAAAGDSRTQADLDQVECPVPSQSRASSNAALYH